jgi:hypothetical protein
MSLFSFKLVSRITDYTLTSWKQQLSKLSVSKRLIPFNYCWTKKLREKIYKAIQLSSSLSALANFFVKISDGGWNKSVLLLFCVNIIEKVKNNICSFISSFQSFPHNFPSIPHTLCARPGSILWWCKDTVSVKCLWIKARMILSLFSRIGSQLWVPVIQMQTQNKSARGWSEIRKRSDYISLQYSKNILPSKIKATQQSLGGRGRTGSLFLFQTDSEPSHYLRDNRIISISLCHCLWDRTLLKKWSTFIMTTWEALGNTHFNLLSSVSVKLEWIVIICNFI